jgi:hypothetical protein
LFGAINQKVIQEQIGAGATFEYTLNGISKFELDKEKEIIKLIWQGKTGDEIIDIMKIDTYPSRYKELEELYKAKYSINEVSNSYILRK